MKGTLLEGLDKPLLIVEYQHDDYGAIVTLIRAPTLSLPSTVTFTISPLFACYFRCDVWDVLFRERREKGNGDDEDNGYLVKRGISYTG
jgi:hypothetical protein